MISELAFPHIRCCLSAIPSDLMKSTAVDESLSSMNQQFCSRENQLLQSDVDSLKADVKQLYDNQVDQIQILDEIVTITNIFQEDL